LSLRLTPQNLIDAYNYLKNTAPFNKFGLPDADDVEFRVTHDPKLYGQYLYDLTSEPKKHRIDVSNALTKTTPVLVETMAHEMTHLHQRVSECSKRGRKSQSHGKPFQNLAKRVCRAHGFNLKTF
jgi:hypothetical protein